MKVGDQVTWMERRHIGSQIEMTTREGIIEHISDGIATVKSMRKGAKSRLIHITNLRPKGQRSELTEAPSGIFPSLRKEKEGEG